ncbi:MAG: LemA family protein [Actinobacteria bacterium]|jgi:LemA protein|nr:LemA family protein [Actinomycetota bacterium]
MYVALIIFAVVVVIGVLLYNSLIQRRNRVDNAWSQIDVQLKRRLDLIPNLVETVKGYAAHEKTTFDAVISARQAAIAAPSTPAAQSGASNAVTGALRQLFALSEAYPDLKANANFLALQEELTSTESRVAYARQFYNDEVLGLNNAIQKIPGLFIARLAKIGPRDYFDAEPAADNPPKVQF